MQKNIPCYGKTGKLMFREKCDMYFQRFAENCMHIYRQHTFANNLRDFHRFVHVIYRVVNPSVYVYITKKFTKHIILFVKRNIKKN